MRPNKNLTWNGFPVKLWIGWSSKFLVARQHVLSVFRFYPTIHYSLDAKTLTRTNVFSSGLTRGIGEIPGERNFLYKKLFIKNFYTKNHLFQLSQIQSSFHTSAAAFLISHRLILTQLKYPTSQEVLICLSWYVIKFPEKIVFNYNPVCFDSTFVNCM